MKIPKRNQNNDNKKIDKKHHNRNKEFDRFISTLDTAEKIISELEDNLIETSKTKIKKTKIKNYIIKYSRTVGQLQKV